MRSTTLNLLRFVIDYSADVRASRLGDVSALTLEESVYLAAMKIAVALLAFCGWSGSALTAQSHDDVSMVNPLIGTQRSAIGYGGTMPFVAPPFAMTDWTAQTRQNKISVVSYNYDDPKITGFMGTHQPAIWMGDFGFITLMPQVGDLHLLASERGLAFKHSDELAEPDYYSVWMTTADGHRIHAEMTATERCALLRFTFPKGTPGRVLIDMARAGFDGHAAFDRATREITGDNPERMDSHLGPSALPHFRGYFAVQFEQAPTKGAVYGGSTTESVQHGAYAEFADNTVLVRVGTSFLSVAQARENLQHEIPEWNFDDTRAKLRATWLDKLERMKVEGATDMEKTRLYTALYHSLLYPREFSEYGRYYSAYDDAVHQGASYTSFSIWDTFRAENSLLTLIAPERVDGMITALLQDYKEGGWMPKWPNPSYTNIMIATHADSLVAEAVRKGFHGFDRDTAWAAVYKDAMTPPDGDTTRRWADREPHTPYEARAGLTYYKQLGFIPVDKTDEAASSTLEDSYDDWCVAQIAKAFGRTKDYEFFLRRSLNDRNLYNPAYGLMVGRKSDGSWAPIGSDNDSQSNRSDSGWTEGSAWVYTWSPLHDQAGILQLMGGGSHYAAKLDQHFAGGHNVHSNEPSHHYPYLYDFAGQPWKTQAKVRQIAAREYGFVPGGLDGDDDCGQMSAWLLFTAFGFYPVNPAST
jgi:predicted alpha-1,2-mannosidase